MGTTISGDTGITFPDATTQSKAVSQATPFAVTASATTGAQINLPEGTNNGANFVALKAADTLAADTTFTLPAADGTSGQVLQTNASGVLSFGNVAAANGGTGLTSPGTVGNVLTSNGTGWTSSAPAGVASSYTEFLSSGTWTKPSGVTWVYVEVIGGGGGGRSHAFFQATCTGGGGGEFTSQLMLASTLGATVTVTVGAGGAGGTVGGANGSAGGGSSFGSFATGRGGLGGIQNSSVVPGLPGASGNATTGNGLLFTQAGFAGSSNGTGGNAIYGGAGGGGSNGTATRAGGTSVYGGSGGSGVASGAGGDGSVPGGGGGAGGDTSSAGGAGGAGRVRVWAW